jgi:hypothetical protein
MARGYVGPLATHRLAHPALGTIAIVRLAKLFANHKTTAGTPNAVTRGIQNEQRVRPRFTLTAHPLKLLWSLQPLAPLHSASYRWPRGTRRRSSLTDNFQRPLSRRAFNTSWPLLVAMRDKKPCLRRRGMRFGCQVRLGMSVSTPSNKSWARPPVCWTHKERRACSTPIVSRGESPAWRRAAVLYEVTPAPSNCRAPSGGFVRTG